MPVPGVSRTWALGVPESMNLCPPNSRVRGALVGPAVAQDATGKVWANNEPAAVEVPTAF